LCLPCAAWCSSELLVVAVVLIVQLHQSVSLNFFCLWYNPLWWRWKQSKSFSIVDSFCDISVQSFFYYYYYLRCFRFLLNGIKEKGFKKSILTNKISCSSARPVFAMSSFFFFFFFFLPKNTQNRNQEKNKNWILQTLLVLRKTVWEKPFGN